MVLSTLALYAMSTLQSNEDHTIYSDTYQFTASAHVEPGRLEYHGKNSKRDETGTDSDSYIW